MVKWDQMSMAAHMTLDISSKDMLPLMVNAPTTKKLKEKVFFMTGMK